MEGEIEPSPLNAAGMLASVRAIRWNVRTRYLRTLFGGAWFLSLLLALATAGSIVIISIFGTRTIDGGQAALGAYWAGAGVIALVAVWRRRRREPISGRVGVDLLASCAAFAVGFAAVFFAPLAHNHLYLSPILFASTYVLLGAVQARPSIAGVGLLLGAGLGLGGLSPVLADGHNWPIATYAAAFLFAGALSWLVERKPE